jgi:hypothetical protein
VERSGTPIAWKRWLAAEAGRKAEVSRETGIVCPDKGKSGRKAKAGWKSVLCFRNTQKYPRGGQARIQLAGARWIAGLRRISRSR